MYAVTERARLTVDREDLRFDEYDAAIKAEQTKEIIREHQYKGGTTRATSGFSVSSLEG